jgi:adenosylmethionine-8-amino-7-oxononanoate aminotransferase
MRKEETLDKLVILDAPQWKDMTLRESQEQALLQQIETAVNNDPTIGAVIYESIPWLWGITPWSKEFHVKLRTLCDKYDLNLILDDVMGGIGKLGKYFSHQQFGITPDIAVLGKAFTGGFSPLSCACANARISAILKDKNMYSHTWQPNMAGVGAALGVIDVFDESPIVAIESRLREFGKGLIKRFVCEGLIFFADPVKQIHSDDFIENGITGLAGWEYEAKSISLIAPVIADDEYFDELTRRMLKSLKS